MCFHISLVRRLLSHCGVEQLEGKYKGIMHPHSRSGSPLGQVVCFLGFLERRVEVFSRPGTRRFVRFALALPDGHKVRRKRFGKGKALEEQ